MDLCRALPRHIPSNIRVVPDALRPCGARRRRALPSTRLLRTVIGAMGHLGRLHIRL